MKRELRIHVGLPKTGTSALQKSLFDSRDYLERAKVDYPPDVIEYRHQRLVGGLNGGLDPAMVAASARESTPVRPLSGAPRASATISIASEKRTGTTLSKPRGTTSAESLSSSGGREIPVVSL